MSVTFAVVGIDDYSNFRLAETLRRIHGRSAVSRFLEVDHARRFVLDRGDGPLVICLDVVGFDPRQAIDFISEIRSARPRAVFSLFVDAREYEALKERLPDEWAKRLDHYYKVYKEDDPDAVFEPVVRASLRRAESEAIHNSKNEPVRLTPVFEKGLNEALPEDPVASPNIAFVSYARTDWDGFVAGLVADLTSAPQRVWVDQEYIVGGDDWMDAVGQALQACDALLLILSPDAIESRYVKMEYRYFFRQNKAIVPILCRKVENVPFELATLNHLDFTGPDRSGAYRKLLQALSRNRSRESDDT